MKSYIQLMLTTRRKKTADYKLDKEFDNEIRDNRNDWLERQKI